MSSVAEESMIIDPVFDIFDQSTPHDVILVVEGTKFYVQIERLSENSEFFKNLFEEETKEVNETIETVKDEVKPKKKSSFKLLRGCFKTPVEVEIEEAQEQKEDPIKEIELKDLSADEFGDFLKISSGSIFYPGDVQVNALNYQSLASMSFRFGTPKGLNLCQSFVMYNFNELDIIEMIEFAVKYEMEDIKKLCSNVIAADKIDESAYPWPIDFTDEDFVGCSCNVCVKEGLKIAYGYPFNKNSFVSKNKHGILTASDKAKAFIIEEIVKTKL